jgi:hypothetical protein
VELGGVAAPWRSGVLADRDEEEEEYCVRKDEEAAWAMMA